MSSQEESTKAERWHFLLLAQPPGAQPQTVEFISNSQLISLWNCCFVLKKLKASQAFEVSVLFLKMLIGSLAGKTHPFSEHWLVVQLHFINMHILSLLLIALAATPEVGDQPVEPISSFWQ